MSKVMFGLARLKLAVPSMPLAPFVVKEFAPTLGATVNSSEVVAHLEDRMGAVHQILAPGDGAVVGFDAAPGDVVEPGQPLLTLDPASGRRPLSVTGTA